MHIICTPPHPLNPPPPRLSTNAVLYHLNKQCHVFHNVRGALDCVLEEGKLICGAHVTSLTTLSPDNQGIDKVTPFLNSTDDVNSVADEEGGVLEQVCKFGHCWGPREEDCQNCEFQKKSS